MSFVGMSFLNIEKSVVLKTVYQETPVDIILDSLVTEPTLTTMRLLLRKFSSIFKIK